jgi:hypothetical protein
VVVAIALLRMMGHKFWSIWSRGRFGKASVGTNSRRCTIVCTLYDGWMIL